jgi:alkanesulfonate monooxygenase SsuD/methylene tetrahydromethanopterin reductase-like flavin-dependent oxidoreductase (luciferase family)
MISSVSSRSVTFRPTRPPHGRLARLGVVLDTRDSPARLAQVARMCDDAGIDALWVREHRTPRDGVAELEAWTALSLASRDARRARVGAMLTAAYRQPALLAAMASTLDAPTGGRLELTLSAGTNEQEHLALGLDFPNEEVRVRRLDRYAEIVRDLLGEKTPPLAIETATLAELAVAARRADDVLIPTGAARQIGALLTELRAACERIQRDPDSIGVAIEIPVSIGRTTAEALARAEADASFKSAGSLRDVGIFGTLEQCQERVIELAHAGVTDLRCVLPNNADVHDVIAQLTAIAVGTMDVLIPGSPKSKAPDPPETWGGRSSRR